MFRVTLQRQGVFDGQVANQVGAFLILLNTTGNNSLWRGLVNGKWLWLREVIIVHDCRSPRKSVAGGLGTMAAASRGERRASGRTRTAVPPRWSGVVVER